MRCNRAQSLMLDSLYGEISIRNQKALVNHLGACPECSKEFARQKVTISAFRQLELEKPPAGLTDIVRDMALGELEQGTLFSKKKSFTYWKPALASAAAVLLVIITFYYYLPQAYREKQSVQFKPSVQPVAATDDKLAAGDEEIEKARSQPAMPIQAIPAETTSTGIKQMPEMREIQTFSVPLADQAAESDGFIGQQATQSPSATGKASPPHVNETPSVSSESGVLRFRNKEADMTNVPRETAPVAAPAPFLSVFSESEAGRLEMKREEAEVAPHTAPVAAPVPDSSVSSKSGTFHFEKKDKEAETIDVLRKAPGTVPASVPAKGEVSGLRELSARAEHHFETGEYEEAARLYQQIIDMEPGVETIADAYFRLGQSYRQLKLYEKALLEYQKILKDYPDYASIGEVYLASGDCCLALGKKDEATKFYKIVRDQFPQLKSVAVEKLSSAGTVETTITNEKPPADGK